MSIRKRCNSNTWCICSTRKTVCWYLRVKELDTNPSPEGRRPSDRNTETDRHRVREYDVGFKNLPKVTVVNTSKVRRCYVTST